MYKSHLYSTNQSNVYTQLQERLGNIYLLQASG